ncbi:PadR family transcriptional regulator [Amycolatopsis sp. K13G38]|uniref:PadR family transcriptional regulator n=1 Tax=Amycolatopsis acididurans TaxID=2724524 RepID=A0ABX1JHG6_9PSEU|nr:PadR family transcriptional regulator [Amycolatopsis acididurans]NKQ58269.1 PadR family transcriptional regulator [Amycolatopsis acididurans]
MSAAKPLTTLAMAVLELLYERPMHPYEMTQLMRERHVDRRVKLRPGSLYHTVERLLSQGFIEVVDTQRQGRRPERTVYAITDLGRDTFSAQTRQMLTTLAPDYTPYPVALSAGNELDREDFLNQLRRRVIQLHGQVAAERTIAEQLIEKQLPRMYWIDFDYITHQRQSELDWTKKLIDDLETGRIPWPGQKAEVVPTLSLLADEENPDDKAS